MSLQSSVRTLFIGELREPLVWQYTGLAVLLLVVVFGLSGHYVLDWGINSVVQLLPDWLVKPLQSIPGAGLISFFVALLLFPILMPVLGIIAIPVLAGVQLLFAESFGKSFDRRNFSNIPPGKSSIGRNIRIWLKWSLGKLILFFLLIPLLHLPVIGPVFHLTLATLWLTFMYFEIAARRYVGSGAIWTAFRRNWWWLTKMALVGACITYVVLWVCGTLILVLPPLRIFFILIAATVITTGNFVLLAEMLRFYREQIETATVTLVAVSRTRQSTTS